MASLNKVILLGNLTRDPEVRYTPGGTPVATFRLATNQRVRHRDEWRDSVCYVDIVTFGRQAEAVGEYLAMGSQALVEGRLNWRQWESQDGQVRGKYDVVANTVQFLSRSKSPVENTAVSASQDDLPFGDSIESDAMDELPF